MQQPPTNTKLSFPTLFRSLMFKHDIQLKSNLRSEEIHEINHCFHNSLNQT